jgi:hypothetical protein
MASLEDLLQQHREEDDKRFDSLAETLKRVDTNVLSLIETRAFQRGVTKTVIYLSGGISTLIAFAGFVLHWWKG